jgi:hypothetical protein
LRLTSVRLLLSQAEEKENVMKAIRIHKLVLNISVGESGDRLTKAAKVRAQQRSGVTRPRPRARLVAWVLAHWLAGTLPPGVPGRWVRGRARPCLAWLLLGCARVIR